MKRIAAVAVSAAIAGYLVRSQAQRRLTIRREDKRIGSLIGEALDPDAWMLQSVSLVRARLAEGEHSLSLAIFTETADGSKTEWLARQGDTGPVIRKLTR